VGVTETLVKKLKKIAMTTKIYLCTLKEKLIKNRRKTAIGIGIFLSALLVVYLGMAAYFINHFYFGSEINGINVSGKSVKKVNELMESELQTYTLELKERGGKSEQIRAEEIGLKYNSGDDFRSLKETQHPLKWISVFFNKEASKMIEETKFDKDLLKERVDKLSCFDSSNIIEPQSAGLKYSDNAYVLVDETLGNKVNKEVLYKHVEEAVLREEIAIDLEAIDCYIKPEYTSKSQKLIEARDMLNKYISSKITYNFGDRKEVLDGSTINSWLTVDKNFKVTFNEEKAKNYIDGLANSYNTVGKKRSFVTSYGSTINIGGGDYGWSINKAKETQALITAIKEGQTVDKEPSYAQTALSRNENDLGKTYVEIDLAKQHLWFYKNGELIAEGDVVTGNVSQKYTTPPGIYKLKYKQKNAVLRGPGYAAPVTFWMPFNGGIGIHDASWRSVFGGTIYKTNGSHGCVNSPYNLAKAIFENIQAGVPVILY
jgi:hypothetical protein